MQTPATGPVGQRAAQGGGLHLLGRALGVVTRRRAVDGATAGELGCARRALTGAAGALLLVGLATATANLTAGLRVVCPLARRSELRDDDLVDQRHVDLNVEHRVGHPRPLKLREHVFGATAVRHDPRKAESSTPGAGEK